MSEFSGLAAEIDRGRFEESDYTPTLVRMIAHVLTAEAPILDDLLVTRIARVHGFQRIGDRIRERVLKIARKHHHIRRDPVGGYFVWAAPGDPLHWARGRGPADEQAIRRIDEIASEELRAAFAAVSLEDTESEIARHFGIKRVTAAARERISKALQSAGPR